MLVFSTEAPRGLHPPLAFITVSRGFRAVSSVVMTLANEGMKPLATSGGLINGGCYFCLS